RTIVVASEGDGKLVELDARAAAPALAVVDERAAGCAAPSGIALSENESIAYVYCKPTFELAIVDLASPRKPAPEVIQLTRDPLGAVAARGRALFHDARDEAISGGLACAGCHPEGRDDGQVWREVDGARAKVENDWPRVAALQPRFFAGGPYTIGVL